MKKGGGGRGLFNGEFMMRHFLLTGGPSSKGLYSSTRSTY